jgi:multidrug efflux pump subunit AcrB
VPVVAGDGIKRELDEGKPRTIASWLGPTKLARAMLYATITNIVAYLPLLLLTGNIGLFLYSMPVVLTCSLVAALIVSKTLIPLLSYYLLRPSRKPPVPIEERRRTGFTGWYYRVGSWAIRHRWKVAVASLAFLAPGRLDHEPAQAQFFCGTSSTLVMPRIWLPEDAPLSATARGHRPWRLISATR